MLSQKSFEINLVDLLINIIIQCILIFFIWVNLMFILLRDSKSPRHEKRNEILYEIIDENVETCVAPTSLYHSRISNDIIPSVDSLYLKRNRRNRQLNDLL